MKSVKAELVIKIHRITGLPITEAKRFLQESSEELIERIIEAAKYQSDEPYLTDPIEDDDIHGKLVKKVLKEISERETKDGYSRGTCHRIWKHTKERLKKEHNITWFSPAELNPGACFG